MGRELKREIGLFGLTVSGVGLILGAGIYAIIGKAAGIAGNNIWMSFLIGAFISSFTGLSYAELSTAIPKAAAEYNYAQEAFDNELLSFLVGWVIIATEIVAASTVALAFGGYLKGLVGAPIVPASIAVIAALSVLNYFGIEKSATVNTIFTSVEALGLLIVVAVGIPFLGRVDYIQLSQGVGGVFKASALVFFAYLGFESIVNLAEESRNPERDMPRALILSVLITSILYVLVALSTVSLADWGELAASDSPLALAASKGLGPGAFLAMSVIALFATSNTVLVLLIVNSRMIYGMARDGRLPPFLAGISSKGTPWASIFAAMILSSLSVLLGNLEFVAEITNFGTFVTFASVNLSALWLRYKKPDLERPFRIPLEVAGIPVIPLLGLLSCGLLVTQLKIEAIALGAGIIALGIIIHRLYRGNTA